MRLIFRKHAAQRMFERGVGVLDVRAVVEKGETIQKYPHDQPYPSRLLLGWREDRPLHVVVADNPAEGEVIIVTVYEPDPDLWSQDFRGRKK